MRRALGFIAAAAAAVLTLPLSPPSAAAETPDTEATTQPTPTAAAALPEEPDANFVEQCQNDPESNSEQGRVWNRGVWCQHTTSYGEIVTNGSVSRADITYTALAYADPADRKVRVFFQVDDFNTSGGVINSFTDMRISLGCQAACDVTGNDAGDKNNWLLTWRDLTGFVSWDITSQDQGLGAERVARHRWNFSGQLVTTSGQATIPGVGLDHHIRCDSAGTAPGYGGWTPRACVNDDVMPYITYSKSGPAAGVAQHLETALNRPAETYPNQGTPKTIPGRYTGVWGDPGLHRVAVGSPEYVANRAEQRKIRDRNAPYNGPDDLPPKPSPDVQADEFPFASTREGLGAKDAQGNIIGNGSVAWVNAQQNIAAGNQLKDFYKNDRILMGDQDEFYVNIVP
ncbi:NucA/NucB deoxyribonuclease domain-containing protein [Streptomyces sp. 4N124]|uniref:NucA/NucB deoxyribonuclease domain-containing protein n=1 Tax=Streptomyces sp. 4N124 TaxID=3457420 RepID=UPI003FD29ACC